MWPGIPLRQQETAIGVDDVVSLTASMPDAGLDAGVWGTVCALYPDDTCEVEFTDREGYPLQVSRVPAAHLELLWSEE